MKIHTFYSNLSVKYKILISFWIVISVISLILGCYSYYTSKQSITSKISSANIEIARQIDSSINFLQKDIIDISTYLGIDPSVQSVLHNGYDFPQANQAFLNPSDILVGHSLKFIVNLMASKSYISSVLLYDNGSKFPPYYLSNDSFLRMNPFSTVQKSNEYKKALNANGKPVWLLLKDKNQAFIQNNTKTEIAIAKVIKDLNTYNDIGFLVIGVDEQTFRSTYSSNLHSGKESVAIVDENGVLLSSSGPDFYSAAGKSQRFFNASAKNKEGYLYDKISGKDMLIAYSNNNYSGWKIYYAVPADGLTKEINSIKVVTIVIIAGCILFSLPIIILISSPLTAPINTLLTSMKKFQKGNFDEKVNIRYDDEMGELGKGYNNMVSEIRNLIERVYISEIREREAELNALQAQINPHFLYNTLDTILVKAEGCNEPDIAEMIFSLSKLFRLSLNRGKNFTLVSREKELIEHYLLLQKIRYKNRLTYEINIDGDILNYPIPKLILQPFVENSIIHGIERKKDNGRIVVTGHKENNCLSFMVEDNGIGMEPEKLEQLLLSIKNNTLNTLSTSDGGYAIQNVNERLKLAYKDKYSLHFTSEAGKGSKVEITIVGIDNFLMRDND